MLLEKGRKLTYTSYPEKKGKKKAHIHLKSIKFSLKSEIKFKIPLLNRNDGSAAAASR